MSNSVFIYSDGDNNEYLSFKTFDKKKSTISAKFYYWSGFGCNPDFDIIYSITGKPKLLGRKHTLCAFGDMEIIDENTLRNISEDGQTFIYKRQTEEDLKKKSEDMKNNIAKYVYMRKEEREYTDDWKGTYTIYNQYIKNITEYTIDEVIYEYKENGEYKRGVEYFLSGQNSREINSGYQNLKIISVKCKALGIN